MGLTTVMLLFGTLYAAVQSATVLDGYLSRSSDGYCFVNSGGAPQMAEVSITVASTCTKVTVAGDATAGYTIVDASDTTKKFNLATTDDNTALALTDTATPFKFGNTSDNAVCGSGLLDFGSPFLIDVNTGTQTGSDCLKSDLTYANTEDDMTCDAMLFYFISVGCGSITGCTLCYEDSGLKCSSCGSNKKPGLDKTDCGQCSSGSVSEPCGMDCVVCDTAMTGCTACTAYDVCTACTADTKALNEDDSGCIDCGMAIDNCTTCASTAGANTCTACGNNTVPDANNENCVSCTSPQVANQAGTQCVACDDAMTHCESCSSYQACIACENNKVLNQAGTACEDLQGYLVFEDDTNCFKVDGSDPSVVNSSSFSEDCTKVRLAGHSTTGYVLVVVTDETKQFTYATDADGTALTLTNSGTAFQFVAGGNPVTSATDLVNASAPVLVVLNDGETGGQDCVLEDLTYENTDATTSCDSKGWYFVMDCSSLTDCDTCTLDEMTKISCTTCSSPKITKDGQCQDCDIAITDCTTCVSASNTCSACGGGKVPDEDQTTCVDPAETTSDSGSDSGSNVILPMSLGAVLLMAAVGKIISA